MKDINFELQGKEVLSLLGRSGSGKTTLLKILAGLEQEDSGKIYLGSNERECVQSLQNLGAESNSTVASSQGQKNRGSKISQEKYHLINLLPPQERSIVYLYQEPLLFPHLNVAENVAFGLKIRQQEKSFIKEKTISILEEVGLKDQLHKMPHELSGGQRQRVSFARAVVIEPQILLLDEPFGALDVDIRAQMQELFKTISERKKLTALFITHDLKEALIMGDRIGKIEQGSLHLYKSKQAFYEDEASGAKKEARFWRQFE
ncbi:MAG: ATP-binding cassette domain-containing protein [Nonlabens sp.]